MASRVSILAPLARGALQVRKLNSATTLMFQSSPPLQGGRYASTNGTRKVTTGFQSSPPLQGGRYTLPPGHQATFVCFNPRPPCKGGATCCIRAPRPFPSGFNPRPPCKGGATAPDGDMLRHVDVSILAPLARGALPKNWVERRAGHAFQSSPPLQGGRYDGQPGENY